MKSHETIFVTLIICGLHTAVPQVQAVDLNSPHTKKPASQPTTQSTKEKTLTVAILDFEATSPGAPNLGSQIGEALTAILSGEPGFTLVDRSTLARTLQEHELNLSGVVDTEQAIKIGKIVGAQILITGKAFPLGNKLFITAKLIGTETSLVEGVLVKDGTDGDIGELIMQLAIKVGECIRDTGPKLVADDDAGKDPLPALQAKLAKLKRPKVAVIVSEEHYAQRPQPLPIDPAVETEIKMLLRQCGFEIMDVKQNDLADWARLMHKDDVNAWPRSLSSVDIVITGEAFSEFAVRIGNLVSCSARVEVNLISRKEGKIVLANRETCRAVDLSENIAGKKALQKVGHTIAMGILAHFAETLPPVADWPPVTTEVSSIPAP